MAFVLSDLGLLEALNAVMATSGECWAMGPPLEQVNGCPGNALSSALSHCCCLLQLGSVLDKAFITTSCLLDLSKCGPWPGENQQIRASLQRISAFLLFESQLLVQKMQFFPLSFWVSEC